MGEAKAIEGPGGKPLEGRKRLTPTAAYIKAFYLYETSRCRQCGRTLRAERSQKIGFGPGCAQQVAAKYVSVHQKYLGEGAKKRWTEEEVRNLIKHAATVKEEKGGRR
jgi:hypothetical protein